MDATARPDYLKTKSLELWREKLHPQTEAHNIDGDRKHSVLENPIGISFGKSPFYGSYLRNKEVLYVCSSRIGVRGRIK